jgi:hypothetical protein
MLAVEVKVAQRATGILTAVRLATLRADGCWVEHGIIRVGRGELFSGIYISSPVCHNNERGRFSVGDETNSVLWSTRRTSFHLDSELYSFTITPARL